MNRINYDWSLLGNICLDLGSGDSSKQRGGNVSLDIRNIEDVNIIWDIRKGIPLPDNSCAKIVASHIIEHFYPHEFILLMNECWRILKKEDGEMYIITPSYERNARTANHHLFPTEETFRGFEPTDNYTLGWDNYGNPIYRWTIKEIILNERKDYHCKMALSGRPHGIDTAVNNQFGEKLVEINPLNLDQVTLFIEKWCKYDSELQAKGKTPTVIFGEIKDHPNVEELIITPLMLTAACVLYHYEKKLPEQRADLYEKVISNLIYKDKRFSNPLKVLKFLMELAHEVHTTNQRKLDKDFDASKIGFDKPLALRVMKTVYEREKDKEEADYELGLIKEFDEIEQNCGLLRLENGQYRFWHLTFQEFLMARKIAMFERDHAKVINEKYWDNDWFKEMIELFIGHFSNTANAIASGIVEGRLNLQDSSPFRNWRLACNCLLDIHPKMREQMKEVVTLARKRLRSIFEEKLEQDPKILAEVGEILGWLGDPRDLKEFIRVKDGKYSVSVGTVTLKNFEIGKYPVTNSWFEEFVKAGGYKNKDFWTEEGKKWLDTKKAEYPGLWNERKWKSPNSPVVGVSWYEAYAFTRWLTALLNDGFEYRLPDENEWEAAASGFEKREYPWGNGWDKIKCNNFEINIEKTSPVGIFKKGNTPDEISDIAGNVWEWTVSDYHSKKVLNDFTFDEEMQKILVERNYEKYSLKTEEKERQLPVVRGGAWGYDCDDCRCADRGRDFPDDRAASSRVSLRQDS